MKVSAFAGLSILCLNLSGQTAPSAGNQEGRIEGKTINLLDRAPIEGVALALQPLSSPNAPQAKYSANSDQQGIFVIDHIKPGLYRLHASRDGFLEQNFGAKRITDLGTQLTLGSGQNLNALVFALTPQGVITGKVVGESGEPMKHVPITIIQRGYLPGKGNLRPVAGGGTNDLGEYRIVGLPPGNYYAQAHRGVATLSGLQITNATAPSAVLPTKPEENYVDTFYPNSLDFAGAIAFNVTAGAELRGMDIQLRKSRVFRVRGQVVDESGHTAIEAKVALTPTGRLGGVSTLGGPIVVGGKFEVPNIPPGSYDLLAEVTKSNETLYARQPVEVVDRNVTGIVIRMPNAVDVSGRMQMVAQQQSDGGVFPMRGVRLTLVAADGLSVGALPQAEMGSDGSFLFRRIVPDGYRLLFSRIPRGGYVKALFVGRQESTNGVIDLSFAGPLEIVMAMDSAEIAGSVVDARGNPAPGAIVTIAPSEASRQGRIELFRRTIADESGKFGFIVSPGSYRVFAWEDIDVDAPRNLEFLRFFEAGARTVSAFESGRATIQVKMLPFEGIAKTLGY
jgi:hypothetical protein